MWDFLVEWWKYIFGVDKCTDQVIGYDDVACTWLCDACLAEHVGKRKMDGSEVSVVAGSWSWRSAMNMVGCRRVYLSSTCLVIGHQVARHRRRKHVAGFPDKLSWSWWRLRSVSSSVQLQRGDCRASIGREGRVGWRGQLAYQRQDSQSRHSLVTRSPQPKNTHGAVLRRVPLTTGGITKMVHCAALDTCLVRWCSKAHCVLACSMGRWLSCAAGYYTEITFKLPQPRWRHV